MTDKHAATGGFFATLGRGRLGLFRTFWLHFLLVNVAALLILELVEELPAWVTAAVLVPSLAYLTLAAIGVWRAADRYRGTVIWRVAAKAAICLFAVQLLMIVGALAGLAVALVQGA